MPPIATAKYYLNKVGIYGDAENVAGALLEWTPSPKEFSNGLICEISDTFECKRGSPLLNAVIQKAVELVGANPKNINRESEKKFKWYLDHTKDLIREKDHNMEDNWVYLDRLGVGGDLSRTFFPPTRYGCLLKRLNARQESTTCHFCGSNGERDGLFSCRGCLSLTYCSRRCQNLSWEDGHKLNCKSFSEQTFAEDALEVPLNEEAQSWKKRSARYEGWYRQAKEELKSSQLESLILEEQKHDLEAQVNALKAQLHASAKSKGGLSSGIKRFKKSVVNNLRTSRKPSSQEAGAVGGMEKDPLTKFKHLEIVSPKSSRTGASSSFLKISSSKGPKPFPATKLKRRKLQKRAHLTIEAISLLAGDKEEGEEISDNVKVLMVEIVKLKPSLGREIISANPTIAKDVFLLNPDDANKMMQALGLSWNKTRDMANIMARLTGCRLFPSEARRRTALAEVTKICATDKLHVGKIPLYKCGKSKYPTLQPFTKIKDISAFMTEMLQEVRL